MDAIMMQQQVRLGFKQASTVAAVGASDAGHDGVVAFAAEPNAANVGGAYPASRYPIGNWITVSTVAASATVGTTFKFLRKGIYTARLTMPLIAAVTTAAMAAISLDCSAAFLDATNVTPTNALIQAQSYDTVQGVAATQFNLKCNATISIRNPERSSAAAAGEGQLGTMRIHAGTGAGAVIGSSVVTVANVLLVVDQVAELFG